MAVLLPNGKQAFTTVLGIPLVGGRVYTYAAGTNTPKATYSDAAATVPNTNPVVLDARGEGTIFWDGAYKVILRDALDNLIWSIDNIIAPDINALIAGAVGAFSAADGSTKVGYSQGGAGAITQTIQDTVRRERLNLYDRIPKNLWAGIENGTNTTDLTPYVTSALQTGRGVTARPGKYRMKLNANWESNGISLRGEGRSQNLTVFENVDNSPIIKLDSSTANVINFELSDLWMQNRDPGNFPLCDLLFITGAGDGEAFQNDQHIFHNIWLFQGRDNISCDKRCIWPTFDKVNSTGALRDAMHIETIANVNQWTLRDMILKGAGRNALFIKHDFSSLATGWTGINVSFEDSGYEAIRITGSYGMQGMGIHNCTFENNARLLAVGAAPYIDGIRRRKAQIHVDSAYLPGFDVNCTTFYNNAGGGSGGNPDHHVYVSSVDNANNPVILQSGAIRNSRFLPAQPTGADVVWPLACIYGANNVNSGLVNIDKTAGSIDERDLQNMSYYNPVIAFGGGSVGQSGAGLRRGMFQQVGRTVMFQVRITMAGAKGTSVGAATVSLPIAAGAYTNLPAAVNVIGGDLAGTAITQLVGEIAPGSNQVQLFRYQNGARTAVSDADFGNFSNLTISGTYAF